jgi:hypothetical protein
LTLRSGELGDLVYSPDTGFLASCGDGCVKLIEMDDWRVRALTPKFH